MLSGACCTVHALCHPAFVWKISMPRSSNVAHQSTVTTDMNQGSFFTRQNTEGLTLVGLFMEGTTLTCLETYSDAKKRTLI
jgi:hypothetical protein